MKLNKKGFTLIELLAIITIMGILMMVAIPAVSRTIENSRRDTFANLTKQYIESVRNAVIADELTCGGKSVSATTAGNYYFLIQTEKDLNPALSSTSYQNTIDLMESGGKSSWGNNDVIGMVAWKKENSVTGATSGFKITYYAMLVDKGNHGLPSITEESAIKRSKILANTSTTAGYNDINTLAKLQTKATPPAQNTPADTLSGLKFSGNGAAVQCTLDQ